MRYGLLFIGALLILLVGCTASTGEVEYYHNDLADTCNKGMTNDPYPGSCGQYIDQNQDGLCDRGQQEEIPV